MKVRSIDRPFSLWSVKSSVSFCFLFRAHVSFTSSFTSSSSSTSLFFCARFFLLFPSNLVIYSQLLGLILACYPKNSLFILAIWDTFPLLQQQQQQQHRRARATHVRIKYASLTRTNAVLNFSEEEDEEGEGISSTRERLDLNRKLFFSSSIGERKWERWKTKRRDDDEETLSGRYLSRVCSLSRFDVFCVIFASLAFVFVGWVVVLRHRSLSGLSFDSFLGVTFHFSSFFDIFKTPREKIFVLSYGRKKWNEKLTLFISLSSNVIARVIFEKKREEEKKKKKK